VLRLIPAGRTDREIAGALATKLDLARNVLRVGQACRPRQRDGGA
jgi:hypothetical protein